MLFKYIKKHCIKIIIKFYQRWRISLFSHLSTNINIIGNPIINQPTQFNGLGEINFKGICHIGINPSPFFYNGVCYFEARKKEAKITIGNNVFINNNFVVISECSIHIGNNVMFGTNVEIYDSDFHNIEPYKRMDIDYKKEAIFIENNVWIGSNVKILKGVTIGENTVIANGAIVVNNIPKNSIAGGIPAKVIKSIVEKHETYPY